MSTNPILSHKKLFITILSLFPLANVHAEDMVNYPEQGFEDKLENVKKKEAMEMMNLNQLHVESDKQNFDKKIALNINRSYDSHYISETAHKDKNKIKPINFVELTKQNQNNEKYITHDKKLIVGSNIVDSNQEQLNLDNKLGEQDLEATIGENANAFLPKVHDNKHKDKKNIISKSGKKRLVVKNIINNVANLRQVEQIDNISHEENNETLLANQSNVVSPQTDLIDNSPISNSSHENFNIDNNKEQVAEANNMDLPQPEVKNKAGKVDKLKKQKQEVKMISVLDDNDDLNNSHSEAPPMPLNDIKISNLNHVDVNLFISYLNRNKISIGTPYTDKFNSHVADVIKNSGFFQDVQVNYNPNEQVLYIHVKENPQIGSVKVNGGETIKNNKIEELLKENNIAVSKVYNPNIIQGLSQMLEDEYHNLGKQSVKIENSVTPLNDNKVAVNMKINEGATTRINRIIFTGNKLFSNTALKHKMETSEYHSLIGDIQQSTKYNPEQIKEDLNIIIDAYKNHGYAKAKIKNIVLTAVPEEQNKKAFFDKKVLKDLNIDIDEGNQFIFGKPEFIVETNTRQILDDNKLHQLNTIQAGKLFKKDTLIETKNNIIHYLQDNGYPFATVNINFNEEHNEQNNQSVFIPQMTIFAQNKAQIGNINITGNKKTKTSTIEKDLHFKTGDMYDQKQLEVSQTKLQQRGFFNDVEIKTKSTPDNANVVDVDVDVKERKTGNLNFSSGYMKGYGINFGASISDKNVMGTGQNMSADINVSKSQKSANINFSNNHLFGQDKSLAVNIFGDSFNPQKMKHAYNNYTLKRLGIASTIGIPISDFNKIYFGLSSENMRLHTNDKLPLYYKRFMDKFGDGNKSDFKGMINKANIGWLIDTTTDPIYGGNGHVIELGAESTIPSSKLKFFKLNASYKQFFPINDMLTVMIGGKLGYGKGFGKKQSQLPFFQNYQAGGISDAPVRAYDNDTLGAKVYDQDGNVVALGGDKLAAANIELSSRIPFLKDSNTMRVGTFFDTASVWDNKTYYPKDSDNGILVQGENQYKSSFQNELRSAAGVFWSWQSPLGAIKLSYGVPLKRKKGDQVQRFQFSLGKTW